MGSVWFGGSCQRAEQTVPNRECGKVEIDMGNDMFTGFLIGLCAFPILKFIIEALFEKVTRQMEKDFYE